MASQDSFHEKAVDIYRELKKIYACPYPDKDGEIELAFAEIVKALRKGVPREDFIDKMRILKKNIGQKTPALYRQIEMHFWEDNLRPKSPYRRGFNFNQL